MSDEWNLANACFTAINNEQDIAEQVYYSGGEFPLVVPLPPYTVLTPDELQECSFSRIVSKTNDIGEIESGLDISETKITLATPYSVPSAQVGVKIDIEMSTEFSEFNIERNWNFKIVLFGEEISETEDMTANVTVAALNSTLSE